MATPVLISMLLVSAGMAGIGILLLGLRGRPGERGEAGSLLRNPVGGWFLVLLGGFLALLTIISALLSPATPEPTALPSEQPSPSPPATDLPTLPPPTTVPPTPIPTPAPSPVLEPDWTFIQRPEDGFAIGIPATWVEVDLGAETMEEALIPIVTCCPEMDLSLWEGQTVNNLREAGMRLYAIDPDSDPEAVYYGYVSVVHTSLGEGWTLDMAVDAILGEDGDDESKLTHRRVTLPVGEAEEIQFAESGDPPGKVTKYLLVQYDAFWFITLGCEAEFTDRYGPIFETVPQTFRWIQVPVR